MIVKPLSEWSLHEIEAEMDRYEERMAYLRKDFAERHESLNQGMVLLEAELARRAKSAQSEASHV